MHTPSHTFLTIVPTTYICHHNTLLCAHHWLLQTHSVLVWVTWQKMRIPSSRPQSTDLWAYLRPPSRSLDTLLGSTPNRICGCMSGLHLWGLSLGSALSPSPEPILSRLHPWALFPGSSPGPVLDFPLIPSVAFASEWPGPGSRLWH